MNAPWGLEARENLVKLACDFFNVDHCDENHAVIGKALRTRGKPEPLSANDFLKYLEIKRVFTKPPNVFRVAEMLERMAATGILIRVGRNNSLMPGLDDHYLYVCLVWEVPRALFRFVPTLGPEYLYKLCVPGLVHITGRGEGGNVVAGTGLVVDPRHILTCRHVVEDMTVNPTQRFQDQEYSINTDSIHCHSDVDVAVMRVDGPPLSPLQGAVFQAPIVAQTVYTLGYPKLPGLRDASVTIQSGMVTNEAVTSLAGESLFLYSAISRPGNSGGPVMSQDGYVVGLTTVDLTCQYDSTNAFSPHYAGIPAQVIIQSVRELGLGIELPFEPLE